MPHPDLAEAIAYHQDGDLLKAQQMYQAILDESPLEADAWHLLGLIAYSLGEEIKARQLIQQALDLNPQVAIYHHNFANILLCHAMYTEAARHYEIVLQLDPSQYEEHLPLARIAAKQNNVILALAHYAQACEPAPEKKEWWLEWFDYAREQGQKEMALTIVHRLLQYHPTWGELWNEWGRLHDQMGQEEQAIASYQQAVGCQPDLFVAWFNLALLQHRQLNVRYQITNAHQVGETIQHALALQKNDVLRLLKATLLPVVYQNKAEMLQWRQRFTDGIGELLAEPLVFQSPLYEIPSSTHFLLAYQGLNDRDLLAQLAQVYHHFVPAEIVLPPRHNILKRKVGFFSTYFYAHSIMSYFAGCILGLSAQEFEVVLFYHPHMRMDGVTEQLKSHVAALVPLRLDNLDMARQIIAEQALDILIYPDIAIEPLSYLLALTRLAPIQCALSGHPETTGLPTIDYYISSTLWETEVGQTHYSETLLLLQTGLPVMYQPPTWWHENSHRVDWGWTKHDHVYLCPVPLFKIHPDFDQLLALILSQDPQAVVVFFLFPDSPFQVFLQQRFIAAVGEHINRIQFRTWLSPDQFLDCVAQADVVLDPIHFGSGVTAYQVLYTGTPIVTWPGAFLRGRGTGALYHQMDIPDLVTDSPATYAQRAIQVASDRAYQHTLRQTIKERHGCIYQRTEGVQEWVQWLRELEIPPK